MALVRCSKHNIPYNDANPRGCPACWQEREGSEETRLMRELARASRGVPQLEILPPEPEDESEVIEVEWPETVTRPPRLPTRPLTRIERLWRFAVENRAAAGGILALTIIVVLLWIITRPTFTERNDPPILQTEARPFPVDPTGVIDAVFAVFGVRTPSVNPESPTLARYEIEPGVYVDALNSAVYAITLQSVDRSWNGIRVGLAEQAARGRLALLGAVQEPRAAMPAPFPVGSYLVYPGEASRPRRTLVAEIRPPNGCYDVQLDIGPRIIGDVLRGDETFVAVARRGAGMEWVSVQVRIVNRSVAGPYAGPPACDAS